MANKVKYFNCPAYSAADWEALNPTLMAGQIGIELDGNGKAIHMKCGPGKWNDLNYVEGLTYPYTDAVTNALGDLVLGSSQKDREVEDILREMISPYTPVVISDAKNSAGSGADSNEVVLEIGQSVDTSVSVSYTIQNPANLKSGGAGNIFVEAGGVFENEGWHVHDGNPIVLTLGASLQPNVNVTYTINIYAVDNKTGNTETISTTISFQPAILWGNSTEESLSAAQIGSLPNRRVTNDYKETFVFSGIDRSHIYIPSMLNPSNVMFAEVTNPDNPGDYSMVPTVPATITVNNGTGTYLYYGFVSELALIVPTKMKVNGD